MTRQRVERIVQQSEGSKLKAVSPHRSSALDRTSNSLFLSPALYIHISLHLLLLCQVCSTAFVGFIQISRASPPYFLYSGGKEKEIRRTLAWRICTYIYTDEPIGIHALHAGMAELKVLFHMVKLWRLLRMGRILFPHQVGRHFRGLLS
jgi:hypothetical protein